MHRLAQFLRWILPKRLYLKVNYFVRRIIYFIDYLRLSLSNSKIEFDETSDTVISLTSWRDRIETVWMTVESLVAQTKKVRSIVLVLSREEFPDMRLPQKLQGLVERGLTIMWVDKNIKSYKKLNPIVQQYKGFNVITVDDDVVYDREMVERLTNKASSNPNCVVGSRGHRIESKGGKVLPYETWQQIKTCERGKNILLTGVGGIYYPANCFDVDKLCDSELYQRLAPTADDLWYWVMTLEHGMNIVCLGEEGPRTSVPHGNSEKLTTTNVYSGGNDKQIVSLINHFEIDIASIS